jgi:hypothetical protein
LLQQKSYRAFSVASHASRLLTIFRQVSAFDAMSPVRVCDSCFSKIIGDESGLASSAPKMSMRRSSVVGGSSGRGELSMADFDIVKHLGRGAFGQVLEVRETSLTSHHD